MPSRYSRPGHVLEPHATTFAMISGPSRSWSATDVKGWKTDPRSISTACCMSSVIEASSNCFLSEHGAWLLARTVRCEKPLQMCNEGRWLLVMDVVARGRNRD